MSGVELLKNLDHARSIALKLSYNVLVCDFLKSKPFPRFLNLNFLPRQYENSKKFKVKIDFFFKMCFNAVFTGNSMELVPGLNSTWFVSYSLGPRQYKLKNRKNAKSKSIFFIIDSYAIFYGEFNGSGPGTKFPVLVEIFTFEMSLEISLHFII